ncbi:MAG TPA: M20/M25/M40 family metallo-hydrolase, partial [Flavobacteriales bacterium]|nr:M20/M25/M40 family metallo-hydrolase [Flavobacteriales bacterium]
MKLYLLLVLLIAVALLQACGHSHFSESRLKKHITYLASDELEGRGTQTRGDSLAAIYIADYFKSLGLVPKGENKSWYQPFSFKFNHNPWDTTGKYENTMRSKNVIGFLDNGAKYTVVIGAHYDHMGRGLDSAWIKDKKAYGQIHNGADDNASGVAGILELAHYFVTNGFKEKNNFLFIAFGAEEMHMRGSIAFCEKPTIKLSSINY